MYFLSDNKDFIKNIQQPGHALKEAFQETKNIYSQSSLKKDTIQKLFPDKYYYQEPIRMLYYTYRPDMEDAPMVVTQITPGDFTYYVNNRQETDFVQQHLHLHHHNFYELMYVIDGRIYQNIEHSRHLYTAGSCCLLNKNVRHTEEYNDYYRIVFLHCSSEFIETLLNFPSLFTTPLSKAYQHLKDFFRQDLSDNDASIKSYMDFIPIESRDFVQKIIYCYLEDISKELQRKEPSSSFRIYELMMDLLCTLFNNTYFNTSPIHLGTQAQRQLFDRITEFLTNHYGRAGRKDLEQHFHYSGNYLYRIVGHYTGLSISDYAAQIRMKYAAQMLVQTNYSIQEICARLGYGNRTQFYAQFKEIYGMTPKKYRSGQLEK